MLKRENRREESEEDGRADEERTLRICETKQRKHGDVREASRPKVQNAPKTYSTLRRQKEKGWMDKFVHDHVVLSKMGSDIHSHD